METPEEIYSPENLLELHSYLIEAKKEDNGQNEGQLYFKVAGPEYLFNEIRIDGKKLDSILKRFQGRSCIEEEAELKCLDDLRGHSVTAIYKDHRLFGFSKR